MREIFAPIRRLLPFAAAAGLVAVVLGTAPAAAAQPPEMSQRFSLHGATVTEGATADITIDRGAAYSAAANVYFSTATDKSAASQAVGGSDYTTVSKQLVSFAAGETVKHVSVTTTLDQLINEATEQFLVTISGYKGSKINVASAAVTINEIPVPSTAISDLAASMPNDFQIHLSWSASSGPGLDHYVVVTNTTPDLSSSWTAGSTAATQFDQGCFTADRQYYFWVRPVNIELGGPAFSNMASVTTPNNLVPNGGFECNGLATWGNSVTTPAVADANDPHSGTASARIQGNISYISRSAMALPAGASAHLTFWYRLSLSGTDTAEIYVRRVAGNTTDTYLTAADNTSTWHQFDLDISDGAGNNVFLTLETYGTATPTMWVDDVEILLS